MNQELQLQVLDKLHGQINVESIKPHPELLSIKTRKCRT